MRPGFAASGLRRTCRCYLLGWVVLGGGMGTGLYDAVFAALGKLYGKDARTPITNLTLFGGFASTVCWPLSAFLAETFGWRSACLVYAALHLIVSLPLQMAVMPPLVEIAGQQCARRCRWRAGAHRQPRRSSHERLILLLLALDPDDFRRHRLDRDRAS